MRGLAPPISSSLSLIRRATYDLPLPGGPRKIMQMRFGRDIRPGGKRTSSMDIVLRFSFVGTLISRRCASLGSGICSFAAAVEGNSAAGGSPSMRRCGLAGNDTRCCGCCCCCCGCCCCGCLMNFGGGGGDSERATSVRLLGKEEEEDAD